MTDNSPSLSKDYKHGSSMPFLSRNLEMPDFIEARKLSLRMSAMLAMFYYGSGVTFEEDFEGYLGFCTGLFLERRNLGLETKNVDFRLSISVDEETGFPIIDVRHLPTFRRNT